MEKKFKVPHIFWMMIIVIALGIVLTYVVPPGAYDVDAEGKYIGGTFHLLEEKTPVSPAKALMSLLDSLNAASNIVFIILISGACTQVFLESKAMEQLLDWATYKLKDKGPFVLVTVLYWIMVYLGGFGGNDSFVALIPIGIMFAKKLKLDPIVAMGVTTYATLIGFGAGPNKQVNTQMLFGVEPYSGFITRFIAMNLFGVIGYVYLIRYVNKIQKDPTKSELYDDGWRPVDDTVDLKAEEEELVKEVKLSWQTILSLVLYVSQYGVIVWNIMSRTYPTYPFLAAINFTVAILIGLVSRMGTENVAKNFAKGVSNIAFVTFIIGLAQLFSNVLVQGQVMPTIIDFLTRPLMGANRGWATVGVAIITALLDPIIPSASAKASMMVPILRPMFELLEIPRQHGVLAYQYGDAWTNLISPVLGWTVASLAAAGISYEKWVKWYLPVFIILEIVSIILLYFLTLSGFEALL